MGVGAWCVPQILAADCYRSLKYTLLAHLHVKISRGLRPSPPPRLGTRGRSLQVIRDSFWWERKLSRKQIFEAISGNLTENIKQTAKIVRDPFWDIFCEKSEKNNLRLLFFLVPSPERFFIDFWSILGVFFKHLLRLWANGGYSGFCNTSHLKPSIWRVRGFNLCGILGDFSRTPSWTAFSLVF